MDFLKKNKFLFFHLAAFVIFLVIIIFWIRPFLVRIQANAILLYETKQSFNFIKNRSDKINSVIADYRNLEPDLGKISDFLVDPKTPIDLIKFWELVAKEENLDITIDSYPIEKDDSDLWSAIGFQLKLSGSFSGFMKFLEKIETSKYFFEIKSLSLVKFSGSIGKDNKQIPSGVNVSLGIKIYTK